MRFRGRSGAMLTRAPLRDTFIVPLQLGQLRIHFLWVKFVPLYPPTFGVVILLCWRQLLFFSLVFVNFFEVLVVSEKFARQLSCGQAWVKE